MLKPRDAIGPYTLIELIGRGNFSEVWLAEKANPLLTSRYALKVLHPMSEVESTRNEAAAWARASGHINVLPIMDAEIYENYVVIVTEYVSEGTLANWLARHGGKAPTLEVAAEIMRGILNGLNHLHSRKVIHRDLKPANILMQENTPRLTDFGIARILQDSIECSSDVIAGTIPFMSPEALMGFRSRGTDLWSAGVIFYQLLQGCLPFAGKDLDQIAAIRHEEFIPLKSSTPNSVQVFVKRSLEKDPVQRFRSAREMIDALLVAIDSAGVNTLTESMSQRSYCDESTIFSPINIDTETETTLLQRPQKTSPLQDFVEYHEAGDYLRGRVRSVDQAGIVIELGEDINGLVEYSDFLENGKLVISEGDEEDFILDSLVMRDGYLPLLGHDKVLNSYHLLKAQVEGGSPFGVRVRGRIIEHDEDSFRVRVYAAGRNNLVSLGFGVDATLNKGEFETKFSADDNSMLGREIFARVAAYRPEASWIGRWNTLQLWDPVPVTG